MSEVKSSEPVYAPAVFPKEGRLPNDPQLVLANYHRQTAEVESYRQELNAQRGLRGASTCARSLHISLFFDGTNNNEPHDTRTAKPLRPTNSTRMWAVVIGSDKGKVLNERRLEQAFFVRNLITSAGRGS
jgi:hypothetical protein